MKRYEAYKNCNIPWIKQIPSHWMTKRAKFLYKKEQRPVREEDSVVTCFRDGVVTLRKNRRTTGFTEAISEFGYQGIRKGDLVIHVMDAFAGAIGVSDSDGKGTPVYNVCTAYGDSNNYYYAYALREMARAGFIQSLYRGIRERSSDFRFDVFERQYLPVPLREEQDQIVRYLDWQVSKINRLIAAKRKQIALLREQIQQTITDVVYHGVDQTVNYQPVKMLYVDKIPEYWKCKRGKFLFAEHDIRSTDGKEELLSVSHITGVTPRSQKNITMFKAESLVNYKICRKNDIAANTMWMWQGAIAVSSYHGVISPSYNTYHQIDNAYNSAYLDYMLRSKPLVDEYYVRSTGIRKSRLRLYPEQLLDMFFPVPPVEEQKRIAAVIAEKTQAANDFIAAIEKQIEKINEFRVRMISDVVTGQIDVRDIKVPDNEYINNEITEEEFEEESENNEEE